MDHNFSYRLTISNVITFEKSDEVSFEVTIKDIEFQDRLIKDSKSEIFKTVVIDIYFGGILQPHPIYLNSIEILSIFINLLEDTSPTNKNRDSIFFGYYPILPDKRTEGIQLYLFPLKFIIITQLQAKTLVRFLKYIYNEYLINPKSSEPNLEALQ